MRSTFQSNTPWERRVGYSRAVRVGRHVYVSGTTATGPDGRLLHRNDSYRQTVQVLGNIRRALSELGADVEDVVRTRIYVVPDTDWQAVGRAHAEVFGDVRPAATMVRVASLIDEDMLVEIEVDAVIADQKTG